MKINYSIFLVLFSTTLFFSCQKQLPQNAAQQSPQLENAKSMSVAYYRDSPDGSSIEVRFWETPRIIPLPKSTERFDNIKSLLDQSRDYKIPVEIVLNDDFEIKNAAPATAEEKMIHKNKISPIPPFFSNLNPVIPSYEKLLEIFDFIQMQGCVSDSVTIDQCIPFQYVVDGCYARAHKMRQIIEEMYGYSTQKCFSFEGPSGYLAVDAGDCCVYWWYHVAPVVSVYNKLKNTVDQYLIDPSMFDQPVSIDEWTAAQENTTCSPYADWGYYEIRPSWWYGPDGSSDPDYYWTNYTLNAYSTLETCE